MEKKLNLTQKLIAAHLAKPSDMRPGEEIHLKFEQTLTHDINAVMCYLAFEAIGIPRVRTETSVSYLDHNLLYIDNKTPDDHIFLQTLAQHYGIWLSRPGNGIMHSVQLARFGAPGKASLGTDSHTPSGGAIGMLAIGGGGMDCAAVMAGIPLRLKMPEVVRVNLTGRLRPGVGAKDAILELLRRFSVKGGLGKVYEYAGPGAAALEVPERMTIANMGAELGATTSVFPSDEMVRRFLEAQGRGEDFVPLCADEGCAYDAEIDLDLSTLEPLIACPDQPDNVKKVRELEPAAVQQVFFGSCTNGSYSDIAKAALVFQGRHVNENVSCVCGVATKQIYKRLLRDGYIDMLLDAGVRLTEIACGACSGIGQCPPTNGVSVRTSNRNFKGRSGTATAKLYLVSPETAAATAIAGTFTTAEDILGADVAKLADVHEPLHYPIDDSMLLPPLPQEEAEQVQIVRGPNIQPLPVPDAPAQELACRISLKAGDNVTTDDITPASAEFSSMRSNIPLMSRYCYLRYDPDFSARAKEYGQSIIIGGENYGQGSSREHAAIVPMYLGVKAVIAKSIARIHEGNLINHGIVPMVFEDPADYDALSLADELEIHSFPAQLRTGRVEITDKTAGCSFWARLELSGDELDTILCGGQLTYMKRQLGV